MRFNLDLVDGQKEAEMGTMSGNRWRLFCLQISFIGWEILSALLTLGIGGLWITPHKQTATAAFYQEISDKEFNCTQP